MRNKGNKQQQGAATIYDLPIINKQQQQQEQQEEEEQQEQQDINTHTNTAYGHVNYVKVIQRGGGIYGIYHTEGRRPEVDKAIDTDTELYNQLLLCTKINN